MDDECDGSDAGQSDGRRDADAGAYRATELSIDATLELLSHHDRRRILRYFADSAERVATAEELVEQLLQATAERTGEVPNRNHLASSLHHIHLPKLTDAGVLEYDPRSKQLRYWGNERLERWLERVEREKRQS